MGVSYIRYLSGPRVKSDEPKLVAFRHHGLFAADYVSASRSEFSVGIAVYGHPLIEIDGGTKINLGHDSRKTVPIFGNHNAADANGLRLFVLVTSTCNQAEEKKRKKEILFSY